MDRRNRRCVHCEDEFEPDPRVKNHRYCGKRECQLARRRIWQREKFRNDPEYKENQQGCWNDWYKRHPHYHKAYRKKNPQYMAANRTRQKVRDMRRRKNGLDKLLVKMDSIDSILQRRNGGTFKLIPKNKGLLVKMDSMIVELTPL